MHKKLSAKLTKMIPREIRGIIARSRPLLSTENPQDYDALLEHLAKKYPPKDDIERWLRLNELCASIWEKQRMMGLKPVIIEVAHVLKLDTQMQQAAIARDNPRQLGKKAYNDWVEKAAQAWRETEAKAFIEQLDVLIDVEKLLAVNDARQNLMHQQLAEEQAPAQLLRVTDDKQPPNANDNEEQQAGIVNSSDEVPAADDSNAEAEVEEESEEVEAGTEPIESDEEAA